MINIKSNTIGEIVAADYRAAGVFKRYGIDFCCNGNRSVAAACEEHKLDLAEIEQELTTLLTSAAHGEHAGIDYQSWPLDLLADYVEKKHHRYVTDQVPVLMAYLDKLCQVHGEKHPELFEIGTLFGSTAAALSVHMKKEELMLFPYIRKMVLAKQSGTENLPASFGTVGNPIRTMMHEHDEEGTRFRQISILSNAYTPPPDACNTYRVTYALLQEFENDLHLHIHLENNILFPSAMTLETALAG